MKKIFAANLVKVRHQLGWKTSRVAANRLGIPRPTYQAYEEKRSMPSAEGLIHMANVMGITNIIGFLSDPNFDYRKQDVLPGRRNESPVLANYRLLSVRDKKLVDQLLGMPEE